LSHAPSAASDGVARDVEDVLAQFDAGDRALFIEGWERVMPQEFRSGREGRSLELKLHAHFATLRARKKLDSGEEPDSAALQEDLDPFRTFLGECGLDEVAGDVELMPLFALPFMHRAWTQPTVGDVFTLKWLQDLRRDVQAALRSRQPKIPVLYSLMESPATNVASEANWQRVWAELLRIADSSLDAPPCRHVASRCQRTCLSTGASN